MSDGALSQEEIDSLLAGLDDGATRAASAPAKGGASPLSPQEVQAFRAILDATLDSQSQNLSMITGLPVDLGSPVVDATGRESVMKDLPEEVLSVAVAFSGSLPGDHAFILSKDLALKIASLANKDEGISELDDMAISAVQECISTLTGTEITVISERTGNRNIQSSVAEGSFVPKAMAKIPSGDIVRASYQLTIGQDPPARLVELFSIAFVKDVIASSGGAGRPAQAQGAGGGRQQAESGYGGAMGGMQPGPQNMQGYGGGGGQMGGMQGYGMQQGSMMQPGQGQMMGGQMGMYQGNPPNVQPVQFASLQMQQASPESGNIGLIMDVFMEMTVELGRTKKAIKEILGMGEGTIIELDKLAGEPVDILVNHKLIAKGEVVVIDESFGVRVTEIVSPMERMTDLG